MTPAMRESRGPRHPPEATSNGARSQPARLGELARIAREAGAGAIAADAEALARRVEEGRFFVACVGQFKRGKSTLIDALVEDAILPAGVVPVTSVVTVVRHGPRRAARVLVANDWEDVDPAELAAYVSAARNPGNVRGVRAVEVYVPHPLLRSGMCLVDTPGLGSTSPAAAAATRDFVPQIDAVIAVLGADPPISGDELGMLADLAQGQAPLLLVLNKSDRLPDSERGQVLEFTRQVLSHRLGRPAGPIYQVSAAERLCGEGPPRDWEALTGELAALAAAAGAQLVRAAGERGEALLAARLATRLREWREALARPLAASMERLERLRLAIAAAERSAADLEPLLLAEEERFRQRLGAERERFLAAELPRAGTELGETLRQESSAAGGGGGDRGGGGMAERARRIARRRVSRWRDALHPEAERLYRAAAARHVDLANELLGRLTADPDLAGLPWALPPEAGFRAAGRFAFNDQLTLAEPPLNWLLAAALPLLARRRAAGHAERYLRRLLATNSARVVNDFQERLVESRRRLQAEIRGQLSEIGAAAALALEQAAAAHAGGAGRVREEMIRLERRQADLERLRGDLAAVSAPAAPESLRPPEATATPPRARQAPAAIPGIAPGH
ncbi:MAG TPA: dynamin family protein [Thermoanaerobaculia bacterium]